MSPEKYNPPSPMLSLTIAGETSAVAALTSISESDMALFSIEVFKGAEFPTAMRTAGGVSLSKPIISLAVGIRSFCAAITELAFGSGSAATFRAATAPTAPLRPSFIRSRRFMIEWTSLVVKAKRV
jgi:hypothetical protein